jgi:hypothetical protein
MFSTSDGEALPVRTLENSFTTTVTVFSIFSSAAINVSSIAIMLARYQTASESIATKLMSTVCIVNMRSINAV